MGDEEDVDIGSAEVLRHESLVAGENLRHQGAEHDQKGVLVAERLQEPHQRELANAIFEYIESFHNKFEELHQKKSS